MSFLDPWLKSEENVRRLRISDPYDRYLQNRVNIIADLFASDAYSIDAIALAGISLGALAEARFLAEIPPYQRKEKNQIGFRRLLIAHCPSFTNRTSIPEVLRACERDRQFPRHEENVRRRYVLSRLLRTWVTSDDPLADDFNRWGDDQIPPIPEFLRSFDYAGCIHKYYRNAVIHELRVGGGREYDSPDEDERGWPIFYAHDTDDSAPLEPMGPVVPEFGHLLRMRFRIFPPYLLQLLREAIPSVRDWALEHDRDLFSDEADRKFGF